MAGLSALAVAATAAIFLVVLLGLPDGSLGDRAVARVGHFLSRHMLLAAALAASPIAALALVGAQSMRNARRRRERSGGGDATRPGSTCRP